MIDADFDAFSAALRRLEMRLGAKARLDGAGIAEAFADVKEHPLSVIHEALDRCRKSLRFFPRPQQLIDACHDAARAHASEGGDVPTWVNPDIGDYWCKVCDDTGFVRRIDCPGDGTCRIPACGREGGPNEPHNYTRACDCRERNPVLARLRAMGRRSGDPDRGM